MKSNFVKLFIVFISFTFSFPFSIYAIEKKDSLLVNDIIIIGNKKTKPSIILRELTFSKNEYVYEIDSILLKCKENLSNTSLFNFVEINYIKQDSNSILVYINVTERWYLWPMPVFELADRNFNEWAEKKDFSRTNYGIYVRQDNFRGRKIGRAHV